MRGQSYGSGSAERSAGVGSIAMAWSWEAESRRPTSSAEKPKRERLSFAGDDDLLAGFDLLPDLAGFGPEFANGDEIDDEIRYTVRCPTVDRDVCRRECRIIS
jgi:hypothetical protein